MFTGTWGVLMASTCSLRGVVIVRVVNDDEALVHVLRENGPLLHLDQLSALLLSLIIETLHGVPHIGGDGGAGLAACDGSKSTLQNATRRDSKRGVIQ
jgi:hypothetical protein